MMFPVVSLVTGLMSFPDLHAATTRRARAIPDLVIAQLDAHVSGLGDDFAYRGWTRPQIKHMLRTAYIVLRDTGRRPEEVCRLRLDCLRDDDGAVLVWDNFKRRRFNRRLPITSATADAIGDWRDTRAQLVLRPASADYLFPARGSSGGRDSSTPHLSTADLQTALRTWVRSIPEIHSDTTGKDGKALPFDRSRIYPYAFRHSYAQRHADAGVDVDALKDLMDHQRGHHNRLLQLSGIASDGRVFPGRLLSGVRQWWRGVCPTRRLTCGASIVRPLDA